MAIPRMEIPDVELTQDGKLRVRLSKLFEDTASDIRRVIDTLVDYSRKHFEKVDNFVNREYLPYFPLGEQDEVILTLFEEIGDLIGIVYALILDIENTAKVSQALTLGKGVELFGGFAIAGYLGRVIPWIVRNLPWVAKSIGTLARWVRTVRPVNVREVIRSMIEGSEIVKIVKPPRTDPKVVDEVRNFVRNVEQRRSVWSTVKEWGSKVLKYVNALTTPLWIYWIGHEWFQTINFWNWQEEEAKKSKIYDINNIEKQLVNLEFQIRDAIKQGDYQVAARLLRVYKDLLNQYREKIKENEGILKERGVYDVKVTMLTARQAIYDRYISTLDRVLKNIEEVGVKYDKYGFDYVETPEDYISKYIKWASDVGESITRRVDEFNRKVDYLESEIGELRRKLLDTLTFMAYQKTKRRFINEGKSRIVRAVHRRYGRRRYVYHGIRHRPSYYRKNYWYRRKYYDYELREVQPVWAFWNRFIYRFLFPDDWWLLQILMQMMPVWYAWPSVYRPEITWVLPGWYQLYDLGEVTFPIRLPTVTIMPLILPTRSI